MPVMRKELSGRRELLSHQLSEVRTGGPGSPQASPERNAGQPDKRSPLSHFLFAGRPELGALVSVSQGSKPRATLEQYKWEVPRGRAGPLLPSEAVAQDAP